MSTSNILLINITECLLIELSESSYGDVNFISLSNIGITDLERYSTFSYSISILFGIVLSTGINPITH